MQGDYLQLSLFTRVFHKLGQYHLMFKGAMQLSSSTEELHMRPYMVTFHASFHKVSIYVK